MAALRKPYVPSQQNPSPSKPDANPESRTQKPHLLLQKQNRHLQSLQFHLPVFQIGGYSKKSLLSDRPKFPKQNPRADKEQTTSPATHSGFRGGIIGHIEARWVQRES